MHLDWYLLNKCVVAYSFELNICIPSVFKSRRAWTLRPPGCSVFGFALTFTCAEKSNSYSFNNYTAMLWKWSNFHAWGARSHARLGAPSLDEKTALSARCLQRGAQRGAQTTHPETRTSIIMVNSWHAQSWVSDVATKSGITIIVVRWICCHQDAVKSNFIDLRGTWRANATLSFWQYMTRVSSRGRRQLIWVV